VQLFEFSLIDQVIEATDVFKAIETVIPPEVIEQTIGNTAAKEERARKLPSSLVICLVIAMSLWSNDSMTTVLKNLVNGLSRQWTRIGKYWRVVIVQGVPLSTGNKDGAGLPRRAARHASTRYCNT